MAFSNTCARMSQFDQIISKVDIISIEVMAGFFLYIMKWNIK